MSDEHSPLGSLARASAYLDASRRAAKRRRIWAVAGIASLAILTVLAVAGTAWALDQQRQTKDALAEANDAKTERMLAENALAAAEVEKMEANIASAQAGKQARRANAELKAAKKENASAQAALQQAKSQNAAAQAALQEAEAARQDAQARFVTSNSAAAELIRTLSPQISFAVRDRYALGCSIWLLDIIQRSLPPEVLNTTFTATFDTGFRESFTVKRALAEVIEGRDPNTLCQAEGGGDDESSGVLEIAAMSPACGTRDSDLSLVNLRPNDESFGDDELRLKNDTGENIQVAWIYDGVEIAYRRIAPGGEFRIYFVDGLPSPLVWEARTDSDKCFSFDF